TVGAALAVLPTLTVKVSDTGPPLPSSAVTVVVAVAAAFAVTVSDWFTLTVGAPNKAPAVASALGDVGGLVPGDARRVSLSGVFSDADGDSLSVTARSSASSVATVSVASGYGSLTVRAVAQGAATVTVTAADGNGGTVSDTFAVTVDAPSAVPAVVSPISDVSGLQPGESRTISLDGVFRSPSGFSLAITANSSDSSVATLSVPSDYATMTVRAVAEGTASIRVTANDGRNTVSDTFTVTVEAADSGPGAGSESPELDAGDEGAEAEEQDPVVRYDANGDGITQYSEYQTALADYLGGSLTIGDLMAVRAAWVRDAR
ncbi:MAG: Ig-like domain-containing protein, partial [bacterium]|nr:Ig-like domain-containing protein [bacterium]